MGKFFKHNEKTDFIVNMKEITYRRLIFVYLAVFVAAMSVSYIPYLIKKGNAAEFLNTDLMTAIVGYNLTSGDAIGMLKGAILCLMALGFLGFLMLVIAGVKKYLTVKDSLPLIILAVYSGLATVSTLLAPDLSISLYGYEGRYDGLMMILACVGVFAGAVQLENRQLRSAVCDIFVIFAAANCLLGIFQALPSTSAYVPGFFAEGTFSTLITKNHIMANGVFGSPFALCSYAVMGIAVCVGGIMYTESTKKRIFYITCGILCLIGGLLTKLMAVLVGMGTMLIFALIIEIVRLKTGHGLVMKGFFKNPLGRVISAIIVCAAAVGILAALNVYGFYESYIVSTDCLTRLLISNPRYTADGFKFYYQNWKDGLDMLKGNWIFGVGPDSVIPAFYGVEDAVTQAGSTDKIYNEYFQIALTTGIPSLVCYLGFIIICCKRALKGISGYFFKTEGCERVQIFLACAAYCACAFFSIATIASTPIFFLFAGLAASRTTGNS